MVFSTHSTHLETLLFSYSKAYSGSMNKVG